MIALRHVRFSYRPRHVVLEDLSLDIGPGLTLLLGPNGSGKSTLLKLVAGIEAPDAGSVALDGYDMWTQEVDARQHLAYISEHADLTPYATIRDVLDLVCRLRGEPLATGRRALERVDLAALSSLSVRELSMGQRRRAVLAAAWVGSPRIAVLDEPLEAMDRAIRRDILRWVDDLLALGAAVVVATHQLEPFAAKAVRAIGVTNGRCDVVEPLPVDDIARMSLLDSLSTAGGDLQRSRPVYPAASGTASPTWRPETDR